MARANTTSVTSIRTSSCAGATSDLRGVDPADVTINLVTVHEPPSEALSNLPLADDLAVRTTPIASANLGATSIPDSLRQIMART